MSCTSSHDLVSSNIIRQTDIRYSDKEYNLLDIYYTADCHDMPVVIYVHGGAWNDGDKSSWSDEQISFFSKLGFVSVSINYSLSSKPISLVRSEKNIHPVHVSDVAKSIRWVYDCISQYGGNPEKIYLIGHSAGAHLVSLVATNERFLEEQELKLNAIKGVIALDGSYYLTEPKSLLNSDKMELLVLGKHYQNAFGVSTELYEDATPLYHIEKEKFIPPFLLIYCDLDYRSIPNVQFADKLKAEGYAVEAVLLNNWKDHSGVLSSIGSVRDTVGVSDAVLDFLSIKKK